MARTGFTTTNYLKYSGAVVSGTPFSIAGWFNYSNAAIQAIVGLCSSSGINFHKLGITGTGFVISQSNDGTSSQAQSTASIGTGTWAHAAGVWSDDTNRAAFLNGGNKGTAASAHTPASLANSTIGMVISNGNVVQPFLGTGILGEIGFWNVALTDAEVAALATGIPTYLIRPGSLIWYVPMRWGLSGATSEPDLSGQAQNPAVTGTLAASNDPPITLFTPKWRTYPTLAAAPVSAVVPWPFFNMRAA